MFIDDGYEQAAYIEGGGMEGGFFFFKLTPIGPS